MTRIAPAWLGADATRAVLAALADAKPRFVGGCVRDALMDIEANDLDICATTPPAETMRLAEAAGLGAHPTGLDHGVVTIVADGRPFEVATLRRDVATDGRRAVVAFSTDIAEDAARRDFTLNALYADGDGAVFDPLGSGLADLEARRIRFIGDPDARIREDYLRILRFFRFHAQFGVGALDAEGLKACRAEAEGLARISKERIGAEMLKLLSTPDPEPALAAMGPVLAAALPGAAAVSGLTAVEADMALPPDPLRRLAALGGTAPEADLRLSRANAKSLAAIRAAQTCALGEAAYRRGVRAATNAVAIQAATGWKPPADWRARIERGANARFPIAARDLIERGAAPGPGLGARLKELEDAWIASGFAARPEALLALAAQDPASDDPDG